jgi:predicted AlkP superfamily pyrophosphatase or phosphodiesterase
LRACGASRYASLQDLFGSLHAILRERAPKKFVYAYFSELDSLAHVHGVASKQVAAQFAALDEALAGFLRSIRGSETALIVTADHGFVDCDFVQLENHAELAGMLQLPLCGEPRAAYCYVQAGKVDQFEAYVRSEMANVAILEKAETLIAGNYYGIGTPHPRLRGRIGDYVLLMRPGYAIKDWLPGERRHAQIGVHGGLSADEMYVPLVVANA